MTIAELVVKLVFQTNDPTALPKVNTALRDTKERGEGAAISAAKVERGLNKVAMIATAAAAAVTAVNYALFEMVAAGREASVSLLNFKLSTGGDTTELQQWQRPFAAVGITANRTLEIFRGIKDAQASIRLGQGPFAAFQNLGLDVNQKDPAKFLQQAVGVIGRVPDPNIQRQFTQLLGWSADEYAALRRLNPELEKLSAGLTLSDDQIKQMAEVDRQWRLMEFDAEKLGVKIGTLLAPAFKWLAEKLDIAIQKGAQFFSWLQKHPAVLKAVEISVTLLSVALTALAFALGLVATAAAAVSAIMFIALLNPVVWEALGVGAVALGLVAVAIAAVVAGIYVLYQAMRGMWMLGEMLGDGLVAAFNAIGKAVDWVDGKLEKLFKKLNVSAVVAHNLISGNLVEAVIAGRIMSEGKSNNVTINSNVTAHGVEDPKQFGNDVFRHSWTNNRATLANTPSLAY